MDTELNKPYVIKCLEFKVRTVLMCSELTWILETAFLLTGTEIKHCTKNIKWADVKLVDYRPAFTLTETQERDGVNHAWHSCIDFRQGVFTRWKK